MKVIGLNGPAGCGKNYVADIIKNHLHGKRNVQLYSFAEPLRKTVRALFDIPEDYLNTVEGKKSQTLWKWEDVNPAIAKGRVGFITVRELLQNVGTELVRDCWNKDHWIQYAKNILKYTAPDIAIFTDARFENECQFIREHGGRIWQVYGRLTAGVPSHASETQTINCEYSINNSSGQTPASLWAQIESNPYLWE